MQKKHDFLICADSDGCVMDTMNIKHYRCFGPCMVKEWELEEWSAPILDKWNEINLYSMTRGVNRFKGLFMALSEIHERYRPIEDLEALGRWVNSGDSLSENALLRMIKEDPGHPILEKTLRWTREVNREIDSLGPKEKRPFEGAGEAIASAHKYADIAVVSSANQKAVEEEWSYWELLSHVDQIMSQEAGSKADCIARLKEAGYDSGHILMIGDAPGDESAARDNEVLYYPVLVGKEAESWKEFLDTALVRFLQGRYEGSYQDQKIEAFRKNLRKKI